MRRHFPSLAVVLCGTLWGTYWLPVRWLEGQGIGGAWISLFFNLFAACAALPWLTRRDQWRGLSHQWLTGLLLGTGFSLYTVSLVMTDVVHTILLFYLTPVWSTLGGWLLNGERLSPTRLLAIALGFAGLGFLLGLEHGFPLPRNLGDWLALLSGMLWAAGSMRSFARPTPGVALPAFTFTAGGFVSSLVILAIAAQQGASLAGVGPITANLSWILLLALTIFAPPNALVLWASQRVDPGRVGILLMTEVLVGAITAALFSGESFSGSDAIGTVLIVTAGFVEVFGRKAVPA